MARWIDKINFSGKKRHSHSFSTPQKIDINSKLTEPTSHNIQGDVGNAIRVLGGYHESLRTRCETIVSTLNIFRSSSNEIEELIFEFSNLATETQEKSKALKIALEALNKETELSKALREDIVILQHTCSKLETQLEASTSAKSASDVRCAGLEIQLRATQSELKDNIAHLREVDMELSTKRTDLEAAEQEINRLAQRQKSLDKAYIDACEDRRIAREKLLFETEERLKISKHNEELSQALTLSRRNALDLQSELDETKIKFADADANVHKLNVEISQLQELVRATKVQMESELSNNDMKLVGLNSRLRLTEQLLEQARDESRRIMDERLIFDETERRLKIAETTISELRNEVKKDKNKIVELEQIRATLIERAEELQSQNYEKQHLNQQAAERIHAMQERLASLEETYALDVQKLNDQIKKLSEEITSERSNKAFIEGALQTARLDRSQLQNKIIKLKQSDSAKATVILNEIKEDELRDIESLNSQLILSKDNVTKLHQ